MVVCSLFCPPLADGVGATLAFSLKWIGEKRWHASPLGLRSIVELTASGKQCVSQRGHAPDGEVLLHGRWSAHQSPLFSVCSGFKGNTGQPGEDEEKKTHHHTVKCRSLPKGFIADAYSESLSWILQKHVHLNKQAVGAKWPDWGSSFWLTVGVHNDSNADDRNMDDSYYQVKSSHFMNVIPHCKSWFSFFSNPDGFGCTSNGSEWCKCIFDEAVKDTLLKIHTFHLTFQGMVGSAWPLATWPFV